MGAFKIVAVNALGCAKDWLVIFDRQTDIDWKEKILLSI